MQMQTSFNGLKSYTQDQLVGLALKNPDMHHKQLSYLNNNYDSNPQPNNNSSISIVDNQFPEEVEEGRNVI